MAEQIQEIPQPTQPEMVPEIPSNKNPSKIVLLIILGLIILAGAVYAGINIGKKQISPSQIISQPTLVPTAIPQADETVYTEQSRSANWKTYTNEKYGFELKYPEEWSEISSGPNAAMAQLLEGQTISGTVQPSYDTITFLDTNKREQFSIEIFQPYKYEISPQGYEKGYLYTHGPCDLRWGFTADKVEMTNLSNEQFLRVEGADAVCYYVENEKGNLLVFSEIFSASSKKDLTILDQILSTFKFLD